MPKVKVPRKSTNIDMTAMCDVAFLLLAFFILATKFKPPDALEVVIPNSVSTKQVDDRNSVLVTLDNEGKVYFSIGDENLDEKEAVLDAVASLKGLEFTPQEINNFKRGGSYIGVPFSQLKSFLQLSPDDLKNFESPGIPVDSANNELSTWMRAAATAFQGKKMNLLVKGDNKAKYPSFKGAIDAFKQNELFKFSMITDPEGVPEGTDLYKRNQETGGTATDF